MGQRVSDLAHRLIYTSKLKVKDKQSSDTARYISSLNDLGSGDSAELKNTQCEGDAMCCPAPPLADGDTQPCPTVPHPVAQPVHPGQGLPPKSPESKQEWALLHALKTRSTHRVWLNSLWLFSHEGIRTKLLLDSLPQGQSAAFMVTVEQSLSCYLLFSLNSSCFPSPSVTCILFSRVFPLNSAARGHD